MTPFALGALFALVISVPVFGALAYANRTPAQPSAPLQASAKPSNTLAAEFKDYRIATYGQLAGRTLYVFLSPDGQRISTDDLSVRDIVVKDRGPREALLVRGDEYISLYR